MTEGQIFRAMVAVTLHMAREREFASFVGLVLCMWQLWRLVMGAFGW